MLDLTDQIVNRTHVCTLMVTHNMNDAIRMGNRLVMMHEGKIIFNVSGEAKRRLTVKDLMQQFELVSGEEFASDKAILA